MTVENWLILKIADESGLEEKEIDANEPIENFNLDSLSSISIAFEIEKEFNLEEINPTVFTEYNTINKLSEWIQNQK
jgi:acyl carrier protein